METTQHILKTGKTTTYLNVQGKPYTQFGRTYERSPDKGHNVSVTPGVSVRLFGIDGNKYGGPVAYDKTFRVGDVCERGSFNLVYLGRIVAIGEKTVTIVDDLRQRKTRMSLDVFSRRNRDFDLAAIQKRNAEWMD